MDDATKQYVADLSAWFTAEIARVSQPHTQDSGNNNPPPPPPPKPGF